MGREGVGGRQAFRRSDGQTDVKDSLGGFWVPASRSEALRRDLQRIPRVSFVVSTRDLKSCPRRLPGAGHGGASPRDPSRVDP